MACSPKPKSLTLFIISKKNEFDPGYDSELIRFRRTGGRSRSKEALQRSTEDLGVNAVKYFHVGCLVVIVIIDLRSSHQVHGNVVVVWRTEYI